MLSIIVYTRIIMNQLSFFNSSDKKNGARWKLFIDGASRNNPGPSGAGVYLLKDETPVVKQGFYLGTKTNNQAEYYALLLGVYFAQRHMALDDTLIINADSELMVKQLLGEYEIRHPDLKHLYNCIMDRLRTLRYEIRHVVRKDNTVADKLANLGIDKKLPVPQEILNLCPITT